MFVLETYDLFLFDFDGLLVNTENLQLESYRRMCADEGFTLTWDERTFAKYAMFESDGVKHALQALFPFQKSWSLLYEAKKEHYTQLLLKKGTQLMPGVEKLLSTLHERSYARCVVTHSLPHHIALIRTAHPILNTIPLWITRDHYTHPKPHSECYEKALSHFNAKRPLGFEDSPRGLRALLSTPADAIFISPLFTKAEIRPLVPKDFIALSSLETLLYEPSEVISVG